MFVLKETPPHDEARWVNDSGVDFVVHLKPPGLEAVVGKVSGGTAAVEGGAGRGNSSGGGPHSGCVGRRVRN